MRTPVMRASWILPVPIIVDGVQIGSWLGGQVLTKQPDIEEFKKIADDLGIDRDCDAQGGEGIPVSTQDHVESAAKFLQLLANSQSEVGNTNLMWAKIIKRLDSGVGKKILTDAGEQIDSFVEKLKQVRQQDQAAMDASLTNLKVLLWAGLLVFAALAVANYLFQHQNDPYPDRWRPQSHCRTRQQDRHGRYLAPV